MTINELIDAMGDIAGRFDISREQAERIAERAIAESDPQSAFVRIWENDAWLVETVSAAG